MFEFREEYEPILREVREVAEKRIKPRAKEIEESDEFPFDIASQLFKEGYLQILIPKHYGGMGKDVTSFCIISEEIAKVSAPMALLVIVQSVGTLPIPSESVENIPTLLKKHAISVGFIYILYILPKGTLYPTVLLADLLLLRKNSETTLANFKKIFVTSIDNLLESFNSLLNSNGLPGF